MSHDARRLDEAVELAKLILRAVKSQGRTAKDLSPDDFAGFLSMAASGYMAVRAYLLKNPEDAEEAGLEQYIRMVDAGREETWKN